MRTKKILAIVSLLILSIIATTLYASNNIFTLDDKILDVAYSELTKDTKKQIDCLADNIYHEARSEPEKGKVAVALVTLNRVEDPRFPKDICGVVKQKTQGMCQFSWFCTAVKSNKGSESYQSAKEVAVYVYANYEKLHDITKGALYYHADYVNPGWKLQKTVTIGRHIFYKEGGKNYDGKTKPPAERRFSFETFFLSDDGGDKFINL
jgi:spore germination cell wall hydrolase CwlJ-like protein